MRAVARVKEIWRYPVKSMGGESLSSCLLTEQGFVGDRLWAVTDGDGDIKSARQWPKLLEMVAQYKDSSPNSRKVYSANVPDVLVLIPGGSTVSTRTAETNTRLSDYVGKTCRLEPLRSPSDTSFYRPKKDRDLSTLSVELDQLEDEAELDFSQTPQEMFELLSQYMTPPGTYYDSFPMHLLSSNTLAYLESEAGINANVRRFRPNVLLEFFDSDSPSAEFNLIGKTVRLGEATISPQAKTIRCSIPSRPQPLMNIDAEPKMTRAMVDLMQRHIGVYSNIITPGKVSVGDEVWLN
ncbi:MOSC N-terminal beta barrel domain-containing protein [Parahaliea sp. F7430]|uniref:MOSC N-terminal beta barrel domain-containing protein n=1 Tax=Sediminihaliea albiluteola TaxID=2758564 RepID=A0A7W2TXQ8_9GAMM|nr:MOSC N-terminal beta barrel domain-containing protein [Sediminihaliea albiluteola]MBA6413876.1 MOSC N-terminal beta barrel domain-containing protein [Sediminihaliea albiluteola]